MQTLSTKGIKCHVLPIHFLDRNTSNFLWLTSSIHQDTLVAKHEDGTFSVLKIKGNGGINSYSLGPHLKCVFWDNENAGEHYQWLFAQEASGDILLYTVEDEGVTEVVCLPQHRLLGAVRASQPGVDVPDEAAELVGCDHGHVIFHIGSTHLCCVEVTSVEVKPHSLIPLPECLTAGCSDASRKASLFQIVHDTVVLFDSAACLFLMYSLSTGKCIGNLNVCNMDISLESVVDWRFSADLSELMLLLKDWQAVCVNLSSYTTEHSGCARLAHSEDFEERLTKQYQTLRMDQREDATWKRELIQQHQLLQTTRAAQKLGRPTGFTIEKKRLQKDVRSPCASAPVPYKRVVNLEESHKNLNWSLVAMEATPASLVLVFSQGPSTQRGGCKLALCFVNFTDKCVNFQSLDDSTNVVLPSSSTCPFLLLTEESLMFVSPNREWQKDDLITWMMSYCGPSAADSLCQANQWTRTAIAMSALESSLKQRQLDTLAFYFKSKNSLFAESVQSELAGESQQLEAALRLVTASVTSCLADPQGRIFAERLLSLTMDFVYSLLETAREILDSGETRLVQSGADKEVRACCQVLLTHIPTFRQSMQVLQFRAQAYKSIAQGPEQESLIGTKTDMSLGVDLEQAVKDNKISSYQAALLSSDKNANFHYRDLVVKLLELAKGHLVKKDIPVCQQILQHLGCDVWSAVWSLLQYFASRSLQQFITSHLSMTATLSPNQRQMIQYLDQLYKAYPCSSFNTAMKGKVEDRNGTWPDKEDPLQELIFASDTFLLSHCEELSQEASSQLPGQSGELYVTLLIAWLSRWTDEMKQNVLLDAHFLSTGDVSTAQWSGQQSTWQYLISHSLLDTLLELLDSLGNEGRIYLPPEVTDYLSLGWSYLRSQVAQKLLALGKLNLASLTAQGIDLTGLLHSVGGVMKKPHPLTFGGEQLLSRFHNQFIQLCLSHGLQLPLWMYCSTHGINPLEIKLMSACSWLPLFQTLYSIPRHPTDRTLMLSASLLAAADLWASSDEEHVNIELMLERKQILAAVGTICYMSDENINLNASKVEKYLHKYPKLVSALSPGTHEMSAKQNTTVYQLLMGTSPFDLRRLFGWQSTNTFAGEDSQKVLPHFSEPGLKNCHSRHQKLSFPYYLKHGRPVYAFLSFLAEELDRGEATLSVKRIQQACGAALWLACQNFNTCHITSSCIVFAELLGRDSALIRSMVQAGRLLLAHRCRHMSGGAEAKKEQWKECVVEIVSELQACIRSRNRHGNQLIKSLEIAIMEEITLEGIGSCSFEASLKWILVVMLCKLLGLPLTSCFLQTCAQSDQWLTFVWFAQLHQYPTHQLQVLLHSFTSVQLRDHLYYVLNNADCKLFSSIPPASSASSSNNSKTSQGLNQNQRTSLYNRIGVQRSKADSSTDEEEDKSEDRVVSSFSSRVKQMEFNESEMPEASAPEDVFRLLFYSSSMPCQWKCLLAASVSLGNPLFAELAACCGCPAVPSLCGWLLASLSSQVRQSLLSMHGQQVNKWTLEQLEAVINVTLTCGQEDTLTTAFIILQPLSPLLPFLKFMTECVKRGKYASCQTYLGQFKDSMASVDDQKTNSKISSDLQTIGDQAWFEKMTHEIIKHRLRVMGSLYHARHFVEILDKHNLCLVFSFDVLDFAQLHKVVRILHANSVPDIHLPSLLTSGIGSQQFVTECEAAVDFLVKSGKFAEAQELTKVAGISPEKVVLSQLKEEKKQLVNCGVWKAQYVRTQYWNKSATLIQQTCSSWEMCAHFFQNELEETIAEIEKALLCQLWLSLLEGNMVTAAATTRDAVFKKMWRHRIASQVALEEVEPMDQIFDEVNLNTVKPSDQKYDLTEVRSMSHNGLDTQDISAQELEVLDFLMGSYLDKGQVRACTEVAAVFGHYNQDLAIIQTCIALATRESTPENIEPAMKRLIAKSSPKRVRQSSVSMCRSFSVSSVTSASSGQTEVVSLTDVHEIVSVMEKLFVHCVRGSQVCLRVITCFRVAELLGKDYKDVVINSPFDSLRKLLRIHDPNKFNLARDFLATSGLSDDEVTGFLADSIVEVLKIFVKGNSSADVDSVASGDRQSELVFNPSDGMEVFSQFLKLCENTAMLGDRILQTVTSMLSSNQHETSAAALTIQTELIIMAHECYTISSNMEGISHVLRAARVCCDCISEAREFPLMIRLLTGVGRYSEMLYIFHALQQHHEFELLLRKGMDREDKLKVAILDYLKRYQPEDNEAYTMVALKFTMYRDIAAMLEACGQRSLRLLQDKPLENNKDIQDLLKKCLQYFRDAAESYVKDNSVRRAQHCVRQARLLSLQLQILSSGNNVINLNRDQAAAFVNTHNRFIEAKVVADAYDKRADWSEAVFNNVVVNGDLRYLQELRLHVHVTSGLVEDVVKRYKQTAVKPSSAVPAIKKLLTLTKDAQLQYRLAQELGLGDVVTAMFKGETGSYLQDISAVL